MVNRINTYLFLKFHMGFMEIVSMLCNLPLYLLNLTLNWFVPELKPRKGTETWNTHIYLFSLRVKFYTCFSKTKTKSISGYWPSWFGFTIIRTGIRIRFIKVLPDLSYQLIFWSVWTYAFCTKCARQDRTIIQCIPIAHNINAQGKIYRVILRSPLFALLL